MQSFLLCTRAAELCKTSVARGRVSGNWVHARSVAERHEIAARYADWEIAGPLQIRSSPGAAFSPPKSSGQRMATFGCGFNRWMQHTMA